MNRTRVKFKVDTGSQVNIIPWAVFKQTQEPALNQNQTKSALNQNGIQVQQCTGDNHKRTEYTTRSGRTVKPPKRFNDYVKILNLKKEGCSILTILIDSMCT